MSDCFLTADMHFGHSRIVTFRDEKDELIRPWTNLADMESDMVDLWNDKVGPHDKVYILGDVSMSKRGIALFGGMNGKKILIKGNHDIYPLAEYSKYFHDIRGSHKLGDTILSHIPIHPDSIPKWCLGNVHGHLHSRRVMLPDGRPDPRYLCVSVEHTDYAPIALEDVLEKLRKQRGDTIGRTC